MGGNDSDSDRDDLAPPTGIDRRGTPDSATSQDIPPRARDDIRQLAHSLTSKAKLPPEGPKPSSSNHGHPPQESNPAPRIAHASTTDTANERFTAPPKLRGMERFNPIRRRRVMTQRSRGAQPWPEWEKTGREPYHNYVHSLVEAGWGNLRGLDAYMSTDLEDKNLVVSVLDVTADGGCIRYDDMHSETELSAFFKDAIAASSANGGKPRDVPVRLYMVEQAGALASGVMEAFGCNLKLDPRFFAWHTFGSTKVLDPSQRHRAPYTSLGFTVLKEAKNDRSTDTEFFRCSIYLKPDDGGGEGWTGVLLFSSHARLGLGLNQLRAPPEFGSALPEPSPVTQKTFRELYLSTFSFIDLREAARSPLYCLQYLFKLNGHCWNDVLSAIREEDRRIDGISEASVSHVEDIRKTLSLIQRGISQSWPRCDSRLSLDAKAALEEDFKHMLNQADLLWQTRDKMATVRQKKRDTRISTLTNAFTYIFAPISLVTGIYGMNVAQINGSPPGIWQFFVATGGLITLMLLAFMATGFVHVRQVHKRRAGFWETVRFAVGKQ